MAKNLLEILEENDIKVIPRGERWVAHCPFHEGDSSPSFTIYPDLSYFCFGCKVWGDAIKFLVDYRGMPEELAMEYAGIERRAKPIKRVIKISRGVAVWTYLYEVAETYHQFLLKTPGAISYLHSRGITDETIARYKVGFTDGGVINPQTAYEFSLATESSVIMESEDGGWWEHLSHRITIPSIPTDGYCDFIMGRTVTKSKAKYLGLRIPKPIYGLVEAKDSPVLFLVEGHFDWLVLKQWGYPAILAGGTNIPKWSLAALRSRKIIIVPDNDVEGMKAATSLYNQLPDGTILDYKDLGVKDVGELAVKKNGRDLFDYTVMGQSTWLQNLSPTTLMEWFPRLMT